MKSLSLLLPLLAWLTSATAETIWQEGEKPAKSKVERHPWWFDQVKKDMLSGGDWISNFAKTEGTLEYALEIPAAGNYDFWVRADHVGAHLSYALNDAAWTEIQMEKDRRGEQNVAADGKPDLRFISWIKVGVVKLEKGKPTVRFKMHGSENNHGGLDCFLFTNDGFTPQGLMKPGAQGPAGPGDWFPFLAGTDGFSKESVTDLSALIEAPAGKHGPVKAIGDTLRFANQKDKAVKFWGVNANLELGKLDREGQERRIKYLRKYGNNAVRQHPLFDEVTTEGKIDAKKLDAYDWWFAQLKAAGIYTQWSVFYHFPIRAEDGYDPELYKELPEMGPGLRDSYGLITMAPKLWEIRTKVLVSLLDHQNPYTKLRYADDPALMAVEMQNEDSIFFWNPLGELTNPDTKTVPNHARLLRQKFAVWVKEKYKTDDAVIAAWTKLDGESLAKGELALMGPWEVDTSGIRGRFAGQFQRAGDQIHFLTDMQSEFYITCEKAIRATGFQAQTITTNWLAGSPVMDQANICTDTIGTTIDRHNYAGGGVGVHGIAEGQVYAGSHLGKPGSELFSIAFKQVADKPFSMSEWTMCPPNQWKLECAPIFAFYGMGLQGWDASFHFIQSGPSLGEGWPNMSSYTSDTPHYFGQWPALALAIHRGDIREGKMATTRSASVSRLFTGKQAWSQDYYNGQELIRAPGGTPMEQFARDRITIELVKAEATELPGPVGNPLAQDSKQLKTADGEMEWDYGRELIQVRSPKTQGIIGKAAGSTVSLPAVDVTLTTPFVSLLFSALDNVPLQESKRILITALARDKQTGTTYSEDGTKLTSLGTPPLLLEPVQAKLHFKGNAPKAIHPLDPNGVPMKTMVKPAADGSFQIDGTYRAYYYEVVR